MTTTSSTDATPPHVVVVVLGDVGRSPRMQYHTRSLLEQGYFVSLVGYDGEDLIPDLQIEEDRRRRRRSNDDYSDRDDDVNTPCYLNVVRFTPYCPPTWLKQYKLNGKIPIGLPVYLLMRLIGLLFGLFYALWFRVPVRTIGKSMPPVQCILVQNPPSIPLLLISYLFCITHTKMEIVATSDKSHSSKFTKAHEQEGRKYRLLRPGFVIDWHNLGYTMFDTSPNHPIKKFAKLYEQILAPLSDGNLCVTDAMKEFLITNFHIRDQRISVLHDRPPEFFKSTPVGIKHQLMMKLRNEMESSCPRLKEMRLHCDKGNDNGESTLFTKSVEGSGSAKFIIPQENQPILLISSTSWTPDEDFSILLDALVDLNSKIEEKMIHKPAAKCPHYIVIVTGKGPQKAMYQAKIKELNLLYVSIITMWLEAQDYPILLGCADLGISLHLSTSNLDLPMKIYDFFGCEVPVCAAGFPCLHELVQDDQNGKVFNTFGELSCQLYSLCIGKKRDECDNKLEGDLSRYRRNIRDISRWRENWVANAHDIIKNSFPSSAIKSDAFKSKSE